MQGAFARKKETPAFQGGAHLPQANREHKVAELQHAPKVSPFDSSVLLTHEKKPPSPPPSMSPSMSEGPMQLRESQNVEQQGRASFEKSVKVELDAMKARIAAKLERKKKIRKRREKKKQERK